MDGRWQFCSSKSIIFGPRISSDSPEEQPSKQWPWGRTNQSEGYAGHLSTLYVCMAFPVAKWNRFIKFISCILVFIKIIYNIYIYIIDLFIVAWSVVSKTPSTHWGWNMMTHYYCNDWYWSGLKQPTIIIVVSTAFDTCATSPPGIYMYTYY